MIASGNSPHVSSNDIKITQHDGLLTEREKIYIQKERKHHHRKDNNKQIVYVHKTSSFIKHKISDYIPKHTLLHTPDFDAVSTPKTIVDGIQSVSETNTITPILGPSSMKSTNNIIAPRPHRKNDNIFSSNSLYIDKLERQNEEKQEENKYDDVNNKNEVNNMLASSIKWKPQYPLHLLQNDKQYQRYNDIQQIKKRKQYQKLSKTKTVRTTLSDHDKQTDTLSTFDSELSNDLNYQSMKRINNENKKNNKILTIPFSRSLTANKLNKQSTTKNHQILAQSKSQNNRIRINKNKAPHLTTMFDPETFDTILSPQQSIPNKQRISNKQKSKMNPISRFLHSSQPISHSMTKKYNKYNAPILSPASSLYSDIDDDDDFNDHYDNDYRSNNAELEQMIKAGPIKDISFLPPSTKKKGISSDSQNIWISDDDIKQETIELAEEEEEEIKNNLNDTNSSIFGSNLSKSLLLNSNKPLRDSEDSSYRKRGYTMDSRNIITPYQLRKQHSLLRIIDNTSSIPNNNKPSPSLLNDNTSSIILKNKKNKPLLLGSVDNTLSVRERGMSSSMTMNKLMGPYR